MMNSVGRNLKNNKMNKNGNINDKSKRKTRKNSMAEMSGEGYKKNKDVSREMNNSKEYYHTNMRL